MIVAIDGPSASGKSTVSRAVASRLGFGYLDTGAMYRAIALKALRTGTPTDAAAELTALAEGAEIVFERDDGPLPTRVLLDGVDVTGDIRLPDVTHAVSPVSKVPGVRVAMVEQQRRVAGDGDWVVEGRDIGTVVFPDAPVKVFLTASVAERARRRAGDFEDVGLDVQEHEVEETIRRRDEIDSTRETSPLAQADGAVLLDTTLMPVEHVVDEVVRLASEV